MSAPFKVIGINDSGTAIRFGGDDLDKINRILNGENLSLDITIDNDFSFNDGKLILNDSSGTNKIRIATSEEAADWSITIPTLGGNQVPVFEDLEQTLTVKTLIDPTINDATISGTITLPSEPGTPLLMSKPSTLGAGDRLFSIRIADDNTGSEFAVQNGTGVEGAFVPQVNWKNLANTNFSGIFLIETDPANDTGNTPLFVMDVRKTGGPLTTRPMVRFATFGTVEYEWSLTQFDMKNNELINASIDGLDNTITNIPDTALSDNIALLDAANTFTALQTIEYDADTLFDLYRPNSTVGDKIGMLFEGDNTIDAKTAYGQFYFSLSDDTDGSEDSNFGILTMSGGVFKNRLFISNNGSLFLGNNQRVVLSDSGQTSAHTFTFPDESGELALASSLGSIDDLTDVDTSTSAPSNNDVLTWNSTNSEWVPAIPPGASGGEANTTSDVGTGEGTLTLDKVGVDLPFKTLKQGSNVTLTNNANDVTITATDTNTVTDALTELTTDVLIATPSDLQVLAYDSATSKWKNSSFNSEITGTATGAADGSSTQFNITHNLGTTVYSAFVEVSSDIGHDIPFSWDYTTSDNIITVTFDTAPSTGTITFHFRVVA